MNILIAGGSGFIGQKIVESIKGHTFINISKKKICEKCCNNINIDLSSSINHLNLSFSQNIDLIINCIDTNMTKEKEVRDTLVESARNLVQLAKNNSCKKIIHLSINEVDRVIDSYQKGKLLAERAIENSGLEYIILRLSPVFGDGSQIEKLIESFSKKKRVIHIGSQEDKIAPIHYKDLIENIEKAIEDDSKWFQTYSLCGPEYMSFKELFLRYADTKIKVYRVPKFIEKLSVNFISDPQMKRVASDLLKSYYQDSKYIHNAIVKPKRFY